MVNRGEFPVPVIKVGKNKLVVPVAPILRLLDIGSQERKLGWSAATAKEFAILRAYAGWLLGRGR